jgi:hypothetical protein
MRGYPEILRNTWRQREWNHQKEADSEIKEKNQKIADAQPCYTRGVYFNQEGTLSYAEFYPLSYWCM